MKRDPGERLLLFIIFVTLTGMLLFLANKAWAAPITFSVCGKATTASFKLVPDGVQVLCPGPTPDAPRVEALLLQGCIGPKIQRVRDDYTVTCREWEKYSCEKVEEPPK